MEPWDGPAAVAFTDGRMIGATLDRNGLRPARYVITDDDLCVMSSAAGVLSIPGGHIVKKGRVAAAAGQDLPHRPGAGPDHRRCRAEGAAGDRAAVPAVAGRDTDQSREAAA